MTLVEVGCELCGVRHYRVRFRRAPECVPTSPGWRPERIVECLRCGFLYATPQPDEWVLLSPEGAAASDASIRELLRALRPQPPGRLLVVGPAASVGEAARRLGWSIESVPDPRGMPRAAARFDAIVLCHMLEYAPYPKAWLVTLRQALTPNGLLYVVTPRIGRPPLGATAQRSYYARRTLTTLLEAAGFALLSARSSPWGGPLTVVARRARQMAFLNEWETAPTPAPPRPSLKVVVVLPAYNAARTLRQTVRDIPPGVADEVILVDDASQDDTVAVATQLGLTIVRHPRNRGYGANQKTCFATALAHGADLVVMVHPDYQYDPAVIPQLIAPIREGQADAVFGSRMMKGGALEGGMPLWKHNANILLTALMNVAFHTYLTEYHSGFRAYSARALRTVRFEQNSDNFVFDTEIIVQLLAAYQRLEEIPIRTRYFDEASSIRFGPAVGYGVGILWAVCRACGHRWGWRQRWLTPRLDSP